MEWICYDVQQGFLVAEQTNSPITRHFDISHLERHSWLIHYDTMRISSAVCFAGLAGHHVLAATHRDRTKRQGANVDPSTTKDCTFWDYALDESYTCQYFEEQWAASHDDFVAWVSDPLNLF